MNPVALEQRIVRFRRTLPGELLWVVALTLLLVRGPISAVFTLYSGVSGSDFEIFYESARVWLAGGSAYPAHTTGPNLTVPHLMPVFGLLGMLPLPGAITAWLLLNAAGAWLAWRLIRQTLGLQVPTNVGILALVLALASLPSLQQIRYGQVGWVLMPVVTAAWVMAREGRPVGSAALMGALITVKPFFGLWLAYYVVRGHWKAVLVATAVAGTIVLTSIGLQGAEMWWQWKALALRDWYGQHDNASVMGVLARTLGHHPATWVWVLACLPVLAVAAWSLMRQPRSVDRDWLVVSGAALLLSPIGWRYYACFLLGPILATLQWHQWPVRHLAALAAFAFIPALYPTETPSKYVLPASAIARATLSSVACWTLLWVWISMTRTPKPSTVPEGAWAGRVE